MSTPGRADMPPQDLTPASGRQDHTILPSAATSLVSTLGDRSRVQENPPCDPIARKTLPRPPHPVPYVRDDRETPLCVGRDTQSSRCDLGGVKTKIFLQRGLDTPFNKPPGGQITTRQREHIARVPDAVRRSSGDANGSRECAAPHRPVALLRCPGRVGSRRVAGFE